MRGSAINYPQEAKDANKTIADLLRAERERCAAACEALRGRKGDMK